MDGVKQLGRHLKSYLTGYDPEVAELIEGDENVEYLRLMTEFPAEEVVRLQKTFETLTGQEPGGVEPMSLQQFLEIESIQRNPLSRRIAYIFGFENDTDTLSKDDFILGMSKFNSPGKRDEKLRIAFMLHDVDLDGLLSVTDIQKYLTMVTCGKLSDDDVKESVDYLFNEFDKDRRRKGLTLSDLSLILGHTDFHTKLIIPL